MNRIESHMNRIKYLYKDGSNNFSGLNPISNSKPNKTKSLSKYIKKDEKNNLHYDMRNQKYKGSIENIKMLSHNFNKLESLKEYENYLRNSLN